LKVGLCGFLSHFTYSGASVGLLTFGRVFGFDLPGIPAPPAKARLIDMSAGDDLLDSDERIGLALRAEWPVHRRKV